MSDKENNDDEIFKRKPRLARSPERSVWFSLPSKSPNKNSEAGEKDSLQIADSESNRRRSVSFNLPATSSTFYGQGDDSLINFDDSVLKNPNDNIYLQSDYSLDPFLGAQATYSDLNNIQSQVLSESDIRDRPFAVHSLVFLTQNFCSKNKIDYTGVLAESSNLRNVFLAENESVSLTHNNSISNVQQSIVEPSIVAVQSTVNNIAIENNSEVEMALTVNSIVTGIEKFNSKSQEDIESFIASVELYDDLSGTNEECKRAVLKTVRSRLKAVTKLGNVQALSIEQIKTRIREKFKLTMSFEAAQEKLLSIQQAPKESIDTFGERTKKLLEVMNSASVNDNDDIQNAQAKMNEKLAVRKFKQNLYDQNVRMMALSVTHDDLYDAISFATEKFEEMRMSNVRQEQPKTVPKENNAQKNSPDEKNSKGRMFCHLCKRKNHFTRDCLLKKKNQSGDEQSNKSSENTNKPFAEKKFNRAGKSRSMNQASGSNEYDDSDAQSSFGDGAQQMQMHTFGAHLNS